MERPLFIPGARGLVGEFYQLVLAAAYHADGFWGEATFDLYPRELPEGWGFLVAAGLEPALQAVESLAFSADEVRALREHPVFAKVSGDFFDMLAELRFDGQVAAVPEGTPVFPGEPVMRLTGSLIACTLLETRLLQLVGASTAVATRAARLSLAAGEAAVYDFGSRRNSSGTAALMAARAAYIGGAAGTTNAAAALVLGVPAFGTMSSTFLAAYGDDQLAYDAFRLHFPALGHYALPDDDPVDGVRRFGRARERVSIVRIDHDDLARSARTVRDALDRHGMGDVRILGSGHLDEHRVEKLRANRAPIDCFAVGRALAHTCEPGTRMAFRIAEMQRGPAWVPVTRHGSSTWPGRKQVVRLPGHDLVCLDAEAAIYESQGAPLLSAVVAAGARVTTAPSLGDLRERCLGLVEALPAGLRDLRRPVAREIRVSDGLAALSLR